MGAASEDAGLAALLLGLLFWWSLDVQGDGGLVGSESGRSRGGDRDRACAGTGCGYDGGAVDETRSSFRDVRRSARSGGGEQLKAGVCGN